MSIQGALLSSLSSLRVLGQQTNLISNNVANANTPGYAQEEMSVSDFVGNGVGSGVIAGKVTSLANQIATATASQAQSAASYSEQMVSVLSSYTSALGEASDTSSLPSKLSAFTTSLVALSSSPADGTAQTQVVNAASGLVDAFHGLNDAVASAREQADQGIEASVQDVNTTLNQIAQNQTSRRLAVSNGVSTSDLDNQLSQLVANLATDLPVKVNQNTDGSIVVSTDRGSTLYDGVVHQLSFRSTPSIPSNMRLTADPANGLIGGLSQVMVDGSPLQLSASGKIAANMQLRDTTLPGFSDQIDSLAGNLIATFQSSDPTVTAGATGLFTNAGAALNASDPAAIPGLAGNIAINARVDPSQGGSAWRIRDGVQANTAGPASSNTTVTGFVSALQSASAASTVAGLPTSTSLGDAMAQVAGQQQATASDWTTLNTSRSQQAQDAKTALTNQTGVNIDDQMQRLLIVQQSYQASAQVIKTASAMMDTLLGLIH